MDFTTIIICLIFGVGLVWYSYQVWFNHKALLNWTRAFRAGAYKTPFGSLSKRMGGKFLDNDPELELWLARFELIFIYSLIIYLIYRYVR